MKVSKRCENEPANDCFDGIVRGRQRERTQDEAHGRDARPLPSSERDVEHNDGGRDGDDDEDGVGGTSGRTGGKGKSKE